LALSLKSRASQTLRRLLDEAWLRTKVLATTIVLDDSVTKRLASATESLGL
jgi:hypothetical protein